MLKNVITNDLECTIINITKNGKRGKCVMSKKHPKSKKEYYGLSEEI